MRGRDVYRGSGRGNGRARERVRERGRVGLLRVRGRGGRGDLVFCEEQDWRVVDSAAQTQS